MRRLRRSRRRDQGSAVTPETSLARADKALAEEEAKHPQAQAAKQEIDRLEQENHLAFLFRQAFSGR